MKMESQKTFALSGEGPFRTQLGDEPRISFGWVLAADVALWLAIIAAAVIVF